MPQHLFTERTATGTQQLDSGIRTCATFDSRRVNSNHISPLKSPLTAKSNSLISQPRGFPKEGGGLTFDQVTPELAAQIVKHYVLPMFDTD
jgi:hypothetical protein